MRGKFTALKNELWLTFKYFTIFGTFMIKTNRLYLLFAILTQGCIIRFPMDRPAKVSVTKRTLKDWDFVKKNIFSHERTKAEQNANLEL